MATDAAGNSDPTPATHTWEVDITPPVCTIDSGPIGPTNVTDATFTFSCSEPVTFECSLDSENGGAFTACTNPKNCTGVADGNRSFIMRATDVAGNIDPSPPTYDWLVDITPPDSTSVVINSNAIYAVSVSEFTARIIALDDIGVTDYLITEHNSTDPFDVVPPYLDPLPGDGRWVPVGSETILDTTLQFALTQTHSVGDTVDLCAWFKDAATNISTRECDSIIYGVDWESGLGNWSANNGLWQVGTPTVVGPPSCFSGTQCAGTVLDGNYPAATDSRLIGPNFQLPTVTGVDEIHLRFQQWFTFSGSVSGPVQIAVWDPGTSTWGSWISEGTAVTGASAVWALKDVALTTYSGERVRIGFLHTSNTSVGAAGWYIDDCTITVF